MSIILLLGGYCEIKIIKKVVNQVEPFQFNALLNYTFIFQSKCKYVVDFEFKHDEKYYKVHSVYLREKLLLSFKTDTARLSESDSFISSLIIDPLSEPFFGEYKIIIRDASNANDKLEETFTIESEFNFFVFYINKFHWHFVSVPPVRHGEGLPPVAPPCYLPHARNITATRTNMSTVTLNWQITSKEDPNLSYCKRSKRWKVKVLKYSNIANAPGDYEVRQHDASIEWITVPRRDTTYSFTEDFSNDTYYSFQVEHNFSSDDDDDEDDDEDDEDDDEIQPLAFASYVYFFGKQGY